MIDPVMNNTIQQHKQQYIELPRQNQSSSTSYGDIQQTRNVAEPGTRSISSSNSQKNSQKVKKPALKTIHKCECQTCKNRKYQDESSDAGVSFKSPASIPAAAADSVVRAHEGQHVAAAQAKAKQTGGKAISIVSVQYGVCQECGRPYVAGGTTKTTLLPPAGFTDSARNKSPNKHLSAIDAYA